MRFSSFSELIGHFAAHTPEAPALVSFARGALHTVTYAELARAVERRADELCRGGAPGCLALIPDAEAPEETVIGLFAAVRAGAQVALIDESVPEELLPSLLDYVDADALMCEESLREELSGSLCARRVTDGAGRILFFTSGTTERSKAVVLTERSLCASAWNGSALLPLSPDDTLLCQLPLSHVFGFVCGLLWGLSCGACVALGRGARHYADDPALFRPTAVSVVPLLLGFLLKAGCLNEELKLILVGAGDCPPQLLAAAKARGARVSFGYGLTETSSGVALSLGDDAYAMTVCPDDTVTLADDGEILIDVPSCVMQGYYKRPADTAAAMAGGVLHTGDLGRFDENGLLHITGRKKDVLVLPDGTKLFLPEAEAQISALLGPCDCALALRAGRVVLAVSGDPRSDAELLEKLRPYQDERPRGQQIAAVIRADRPLPRTATGKIKRWELQGRIEA